MTLTIEISRDQLERFIKTAQRLGVEPDELARAAVIDLLERPAEDFERAASHALQKNRELYRRLG